MNALAFPGAIMDSFFPFAVLIASKAAILLALALGANLLLRRRSASLRHLVWSLALGGALVLPAVAAVSPLTWHLLPEQPVPVRSIASDVRHEVTGSPGAAPRVNATAAVSELPAAAISPTESREPKTGSRTPAILLTLWLAGAVLLLGRFLYGMARVRRIARRAVPVNDASWLAAADRVPVATPGRPYSLRISSDVAMPFVSGVLRPVIVLPASSLEWSHQRRDAVLQHELAHLSRGDLLMNIVAHLARALHWFNPLAWLAAHRLRIESERACDDAVLRRGARASDYADHLLSIATTDTPALPGAALAMARRSAFEGRLLAILEPGVERTAPTRWRVASSVAALIVVILPLAAASPTARVSAMTPEPGAIVTIPAAPASALALVQEPSPAAQREVPAQPVAQAGSAVLALIETLADANAAVRLAAVSSLGSLEDPRAIAALGKALKEDADPRVREAAAEALGEIDDPRAVPHLVDALRSERMARVRVRIIESLGEIDDPSAVPGVMAATRDSSAAVRRAAVSALGEFEDQSALNAIMALARDEDVQVRREVASALGELENPASFNTLVLLTRDADDDVREHAVDALGELEDPRALDVFVAALKDPSADVRSQAADAIQNIPDLRTAPAALMAALTDSDHEVRHNVAHALGDIGDERAVPVLRRALAEPNVDVRRAVAEALANIGGVEAMQVMMGLLKDQDPEIRRIAAEAMGKRR